MPMINPLRASYLSGKKKEKKEKDMFFLCLRYMPFVYDCVLKENSSVLGTTLFKLFDRAK